jgi:hypothetical protein
LLAGLPSAGAYYLLKYFGTSVPGSVQIVILLACFYISYYGIRKKIITQE